MPNKLKQPKSLSVSFKFLERGLKVEPFKGGNYRLTYPKAVYNAFPQAGRRWLAENFTYARTRPLTLFGEQLSYQSPAPALKKFINWGISRDLPCIADLNGLSAKKTILDFKIAGRNIVFAKQAPANLPALNSLPNRAVLALSFGKDSLLSYGLAKELGLKYQLVCGNEMETAMGGEWKVKNQIIKKFCQQEKVRVQLFSDNVDELFYHRRFKKHLTEADDTNSMLAYAIELLPFIYQHRAKYLILGNERNLSDYFTGQQGEKIYPSYDQSSAYTKAENKEWRRLTRGKFQVFSFLEPLYNLAEMKILYSRYPRLLQYLMSCAPQAGSNERWCYNCPMCAKAFLYSSAWGDPKKIAFNRNFFDKKYAEHYPIFATKKLRHYERPPQVKEEQLLAFLLCYRAGLKGDLIDLFKKRYLTKVSRQEKNLRKKYLGIHPAVNLPAWLTGRVLSIFKRELKDWS